MENRAEVGDTIRDGDSGKHWEVCDVFGDGSMRCWRRDENTITYTIGVFANYTIVDKYQQPDERY